MEGLSETTFPRDLEEISTTKPVYKGKSPHKKKKPEKQYGETVALLDCSPFFRKFGVKHPGLRRIWFVKDICGLVCAVMTWLLILYAMYVMLFVMLLHESYSLNTIVHGSIFYFFSFLAIASHLRTMLSDPGAVPKGNATSEGIRNLGLKQGQVVFKCPKCISIKPDRAHHCSVCQRCIRKMDHHCPWVNNCVGENNQKYFILFTIYICFISIHAFYLAIMHFITCVGKDWKGCSGASPAATTILLIFLIFEGMLFGIFTAIMFGTQISAVCSDETGIEQLKKEQRERKSFWMSLKSVFGHPFSIHWFSPFSTPRFLSAEKVYYSV